MRNKYFEEELNMHIFIVVVGVLLIATGVKGIVGKSKKD